MDKYTLKIVTLSSHDLKSKIEKVADPERVTTVVTAGDVNQVESYKKADIILLNYSLALEKIEEIQQNKEEFTHIVLLQDCEISDNLHETLLKYPLWDTSSNGIFHQITAMKEQMKVYFDLELTKNQLYTLIDSVPDLIWYKDLQGLHIDVNEPFCKSVSKTRKEIKYQDQGFIMGLTPEEFAKGDFACVNTDNYVIKEQNTSLFDEKVLIHDEMRQFKTYKTALRGRNGESIGTVGMAHDVTDIWNTHEEFRIVISRLPFPMIILDKNYSLLSFNSKFGELFYYNEANQGDFNISKFGKQYFDVDLAMLEKNNTTIERKMDDDGEIFHYIIEKSEITDVFGELSGYFYIFRDVTKTHNYEEQLRLMAETDELTQIYNRKFIREFFETKLRVFVKEKLSFAISIIDIDYFKLYNDHYGHLEGDMAIKSIANILKSHSDNEKVFVARFGGEEFIVMFIDKTPQEVESLLDHLMKDLAQAQIPHEKSKVDKVLTMSIGCHYLPELKNDMQLVDLIEIADKFLYQSKEEGRNRYISNI